MDPQLQAMATELGEVAIRNSVATVGDRIRSAKAKRNAQETGVELEEIIQDLQSDKADLLRIARGLEDELVAQRISADDVKYIAETVFPLVEQLAMASAASRGEDEAQARQVLEAIKPLLSVETVTVLQLLGFNFRRAIGEPLTALLSRMILSKAPPDPNLALEIQRTSLAQQAAFLEVLKDPEARERLQS